MRAYYFSKLVSDLPMQVVSQFMQTNLGELYLLQILCPTTYLLITYFMTDQPMEADRLLKVLLLGVLVTMMAQALGHTFGAAFDAQVYLINKFC